MKRPSNSRVPVSPRHRISLSLLLALALSQTLIAGCVVRGHREGVAPAPDQPDDCPYPLHGFNEVPVMNLPLEARCKNYNGGSCVCASTISCMQPFSRGSATRLFNGTSRTPLRVRRRCSFWSDR